MMRHQSIWKQLQMHNIIFKAHALLNQEKVGDCQRVRSEVIKIKGEGMSTPQGSCSCICSPLAEGSPSAAAICLSTGVQEEGLPFVMLSMTAGCTEGSG